MSLGKSSSSEGRDILARARVFEERRITRGETGEGSGPQAATGGRAAPLQQRARNTAELLARYNTRGTGHSYDPPVGKKAGAKGYQSLEEGGGEEETIEFGSKKQATKASSAFGGFFASKK